MTNGEIFIDHAGCLREEFKAREDHTRWMPSGNHGLSHRETVSNC